MSFVKLTREHRVAILALARGKANALNAELVDELSARLEELAADAETRALVITSDVPRMFSGGFDVLEVFQYPREPMAKFFRRFVALFERIRTLPKPVVCALTGHAFAGGAILALAADFRVMADDAKLSVNEVDLAVMLPASMIRALARAAQPELASSMLLGAEVISARRALAGGLASDVLPANEVLTAAIQRARQLGDKPQAAFAAHKRALDSADFGPPSEAELATTIDAWFDAESSACRQALLEKLTKKNT